METRPFVLLIAALGGEGGGVLAGWITEADLVAQQAPPAAPAEAEAADEQPA